MRIRRKFTISLLITAMLPLVISMGLALWHSTNQTTKLTLDSVQGRLDTAAQKLSRFFSERIAEVSTYSQTDLLKTMNFSLIRPFLLSEKDRHQPIYEKFILGTPEGYFYNTSGGNPNVGGGLRTFNDKDPKAKPKHIRKRDYWQQTVGKNSAGDQITYVSDPMISYTTGAKQVVVASTILSPNGTVKGMIGGALPWTDIQKRIKKVNDDVIDQLGWAANIFLISNTGTYWYHWDPEKVVHLKLDENNQPVLNEIGEKVIVKKSIRDEAIPELVSAGMSMTKGGSGFTSYKDPTSGQINFIVFSPIASSNYSIGLIVPQKQMMSAVKNLQSMFVYAFLGALLFVVLVAMIASRKFSSPIVLLNKMAKEISQGNWNTKLKPQGQGEIRELTESFNTMADTLQRRENLLKKSEETLAKINTELEQRITERTQELEKVNDILKDEINERFAIEAALRSSEELLKNTGHLARIGGWKYSIETNQLSWTEETYCIHNVPTDQDIDLNMAIDFIAPDLRTTFKDAIEKALDKGTSFDLELLLTPADGKQFWVRVICHASTENGKVVEIVGAYQDISELKKVELLKREFVSVVSHELRTPLTSIRGSLSMLNSGAVELNDDVAKQMLDIAERNSERLLLLINDLLDMEKIETGKLEFILEAYCLTDLVKQSLVENESYAKQLNANFRLTTDIPEVQVNVDKERFLQVMSNLLSNAAKFTRPGTTIDITVLPIKDETVCVSVRDYGEGIPEEFQDKVFIKFSQADSADNRKIGGTGLGLSISKSIVERMDGKLSFESTTGEGAAFLIMLPIVNVAEDSIPIRHGNYS